MCMKQLIKNMVHRLINLSNKGGRLNEILLNELIQSINGNKFHHSVIDRIFLKQKLNYLQTAEGDIVQRGAMIFLPELAKVYPKILSLMVFQHLSLVVAERIHFSNRHYFI